MPTDRMRSGFACDSECWCMKTKNKKTSLVAHITTRGLEALTRGRIDLSDPRLDGELGTVQLELHTDRETARQMQFEIEAAQALIGNEGALHHLDEAYILPWRVKIALITTGDSEIDSSIKSIGAAEGHLLNMATA